MRVLVLALALGCAVALSYNAAEKAKKLEELREAQKHDEKEAASDCSAYPLAQAVKDCTKDSACLRADAKWHAEEASFLKSAKSEWAKILEDVQAATKANETLASYSADLAHVRAHLLELRTARNKATAAASHQAAKDQLRTKYANDALTVVSRLKNYVQLADDVDSAHDFVVPLYNVQGGDDKVNSMLGGVIKVLLGDVTPADRKAVYTNELVRVEADLIALMKSIYEEEPKSRMEFQTKTLPKFSADITEAKLEEKEMVEKVEAVKNMVQHKMKNLPVDKTYHAVLLKRYEQARSSRALNRDQCIARQKAYADSSAKRNEEIKVLEAIKTVTAQQLAVKAAAELEDLRKQKENLKKKAFHCPRDDTCTGTIDSPCRLPWADVHGQMYCAYSVTTTRRQKNLYQQPGWIPIYPSCIGNDAVGCMLRPAAELETIKNPEVSTLKQYKSTLLSTFAKGSFNPELKTREGILAQCETLNDAQLNAKGARCFSDGCGLVAGKPCFKEWTTAAGDTACLLSRPEDHRDSAAMQNPGWLPVCPATVLGEMHACAPKGLEDKQCNPHVELRDVANPGKGEAVGCAPVDCEVTDWGQWSACSRTCATGHRFRQRGIIQAASCGGAKCPSLLHKAECDSGRQCPLPEGRECSHVFCSVEKKTVKGKEHKFVKVQHDNSEEHGENHHCAFNPYDAKCHCACTQGAPYKPLVSLP